MLAGSFAKLDHCAHLTVLYLMTFHEDNDWAKLRKVPGGMLKKPEKWTERMIVKYL